MAVNACARTATPTTEPSFAKCLECGRTFILEPVGPRYDDAYKGLEQKGAIFLVQEDVLASVAARHDVVKSAGILNADAACHPRRIATHRRSIKK